MVIAVNFALRDIPLDPVNIAHLDYHIDETFVSSQVVQTISSEPLSHEIPGYRSDVLHCKTALWLIEVALLGSYR